MWATTSPVVGLWGSWEVPDWTKLPRSACPVCESTRSAFPASLRPTFSGTFDLGPLSNFMLFTTRLSTFCALDAERGALSPLARLPLVRTHISSLSSASYAFLATSRWFGPPQFMRNRRPRTETFDTKYKGARSPERRQRGANGRRVAHPRLPGAGWAPHSTAAKVAGAKVDVSKAPPPADAQATQKVPLQSTWSCSCERTPPWGVCWGRLPLGGVRIERQAPPAPANVCLPSMSAGRVGVARL